MIEKDSIRKFIFKDELNYIFEKYCVCDTDKDKIFYSIFENSLDFSKALVLADGINDFESLSNKIKKVIKNNKVVGAIGSLFLIQDDLVLPINIKKIVLKNEKLGILVGAGISKLINLPLWSELAKSAIEFLRDNHFINYFECQRILSEIQDPKQRLTIFHEFIPKSDSQAEDFYRTIFDKVNNKKKNPYDLLVKFDSIKLTTNIDNEFYNSLSNRLHELALTLERGYESSIQREPCIPDIKYKDFSSVDDINYRTIYNLHGTLDDISTTVLTTKDYINAYFKDVNGLKKFLERVFKEYTIIFIGYGLEEFPILEHIISGSKDHYALIGEYFNDINLFKMRQKYLKSLSINPIRYYLDFYGYDRLYVVLHSWVRQIEEERGRPYYEKIKELDDVINVE